MKARVFMFTDIESAQIGGPDLFRAWGSQDRPNRGRSPLAAVLKADSSLRRTLSLKEIGLEGTGRKNAVLGIRGGSWNNESSNLQVSNRNNAGNTNASRNNNYGVRAARTTSPAGLTLQKMQCLPGRQAGIKCNVKEKKTDEDA